jgi:transposase
MLKPGLDRLCTQQKSRRCKKVRDEEEEWEEDDWEEEDWEDEEM